MADFLGVVLMIAMLVGIAVLLLKPGKDRGRRAELATAFAAKDNFAASVSYTSPEKMFWVGISESSALIRLGKIPSIDQPPITRDIPIGKIIRTEVHDGNDVVPLNTLANIVTGAVVMGGAGALLGALGSAAMTEVNLLLYVDDVAEPIITTPMLEFKKERGSKDHLAAIEAAARLSASIDVMQRRINKQSALAT